MSQALYRKWRPHLWDEVIGQDHVVVTLQNAIRSERVGHAYLFAGPRGTGKTSTARLLAKAVNCLNEDLQKRPCDRCEHCQAVNKGSFLDLIEIDAASNTSVEDVRSLRDKINFAPTQGRFKVYIIDEVHMLSTAAFNALLKTLEEPPPHAIFILATTEVHKIPATVLSRCQRHEFRRIPVIEITAQLRKLCSQEKLNVDDDALLLIARQATGSMRDAISLLDQLSATGERVDLAAAQLVLGTATNQLVIELVDALLARDVGAGLTCIHRALDSGSDPRQFARQVVDYLRGLMMVLLGNSAQVETTPEMRAQMELHAARFDIPRLTQALRLFNAAASDTRSGWQPGLLLELATAESVEAPTQSIPPAPVQTTNPRPIAAIPTPAAPEIQPAVALPVPAQAVSPAPPPKKPPEKTAPTPAAAAPPVPERAQASPAPPAGPKTAIQPPVAAAASGSLRFTFQDMLQSWGRIRAAVKKVRPQTEALVNSCKPLGVKDGALVLGFASELLKSKMEAGDNLQAVHQGIVIVLGSDIAVQCAVMSSKGGTQSASDLGVDGDGIVGTALNLGGKIVNKD